MTTAHDPLDGLSQRQRELFRLLTTLPAEQLPDAVRDYAPSQTQADAFLAFVSEYPHWITDLDNCLHIGKATKETYDDFSAVLKTMQAIQRRADLPQGMTFQQLVRLEITVTTQLELISLGIGSRYR